MTDFMDISQHTARKTHKCYLCGGEIEIGEKYYRHRYKAYGEFRDECYHESCETILNAYFRAHKDDDEWDVWAVKDWLQENYCDWCDKHDDCGCKEYECEKIKSAIAEKEKNNA